MSQTDPNQEVFRALEAGTSVVTATRRLARFVTEQYADFQRRRGQTTWPSPKINSWSDWLRGLWHGHARRGRSAPLLLTEAQTNVLWESVITGLGRRDSEMILLNMPATARAARRAWKLLCDWNFTVSDLDPGVNTDAAEFVRWSQAFEAAKRDRGWIVVDELGTRIRELSEAGGLPIAPVVLLGFDDMTPNQLALQKVFAAVRLPQYPMHLGTNSSSASAIGCVDGEAEFTHAVLWARGQLANANRGPLGIVVPDLHRQRDRVVRILDQVLRPDMRLADDTEAGCAYHVSLGRPLTEYPMIDAALLILQFAAGFDSVYEVSRLLRTPFCGGADAEFPQRSRLDDRLRRKNIQRLTHRSLRRWLERFRMMEASGGCPRLYASLRAAQRIPLPTRQSAAHWASHFNDWLAAFGWPGDAPLNSAEYQTVKAWHDLLGQFAGLALVSPDLDLRQALRRLTRIARDRIYQPRADPAPVQVMDIVESAGMHFSGLWVSGMSDLQWPPPIRPNPFLPIAFQRQHAMPGSDPHTSLDHAHRVSQRWLSSAPEVMISFAREFDEQQVQVSPLFAHIPPWAGAIPPSNVIYAQQLNAERPALERLDDATGPRFANDQRVPGGAGVFRDQATCPFRSFARYRLRVREVPDVEPGLDPSQRGTLVHQCLAELWRVLHDQQGLLARTPPLLQDLLDRIVGDVLARLPGLGSNAFHRAFIALEHQRLRALLGDWLEQERERPPFSVVESERVMNTTVAGLPIIIRIDRIDRLADGSLLIVDYKTGRPLTVERWFGERPEEPQLPVYLLAIDEPAHAIAFGRLHRGACQWIGLSKSEAPAPGITPIDKLSPHGVSTWQQAVAHWRNMIAELANGFRKGDARVDPKTPAACRHCEVRPLCRITEHQHRIIVEQDQRNAG